MQFDCSDCTLKNQVLGPILPCQQAKPVFKTPIDDQAAATKQVPLLHLLNELTVAAYNPQARDVRATWTARKYSARTGQPLAQRLVHVEKAKAENETREMVAMLFAQQPHLLPLLAQLDGPGQRAAATAIAKLLQGQPLEEAIPSRFELDLFRGTTHLTLGRSLKEPLGDLKQKQAALLQQLDTYPEKFQVLERRQRVASQAIAELDNELLNAQAAKRAQETLIGDQAQYCDLLRRQLGPLVDDDGYPLKGMPLEFALDLLTNTPEGETQARQALEGYANQSQKLFAMLHQLQQADPYIAALEEKRNQILADLAQSEGLFAEYDRKLLEYELLRIEERHLQESLQETRQLGPEERERVQNEALKNDFGLNRDNYADLQDFVELQEILDESPVARQMYLAMHPSLKYTNDPVLRCKVQKLLAFPPMLAAMDALDKANLIHPGPYAKLGVFVNNALVPGSYDDRHREMIQSELGQIQQAMFEHGMDPTVHCHSCGTTDPSGRTPQELSLSWIRDHNPPTSLYELGPNIYATHLGLPDFSGQGKSNGQILLPQCRECSKRQGALTSKVVKLISQVPPLTLQDPNFKMRDWLQAQFVKADAKSGAADWADFVRVALTPFNGWKTPADNTGLLQGFDLTTLVTTGGAGSFAGIDGDLLMQLGNSVGCHTCTDVNLQTDPFRNILWVADHQPPTSLVARGLAELPQIVYPHCWKCSDTQAQLARNVGRIFDQGFTPAFKDDFSNMIRQQAWTNT